MANQWWNKTMGRNKVHTSSSFIRKPELGFCRNNDEPREGGMNMAMIRRPRGHPRGSKNKPKSGPVMTPDSLNVIESHILEIASGGNITNDLIQFGRRKERGFSVLSATGSIRNVSLQQSLIPNTVMRVEGELQILSLSGSFLGGGRPPSLSVYLAGGKGEVVGGKVVGPLVASGTVFIVLGVFSNAAYQRLPIEEGEEEASSSSYPLYHPHNLPPPNS